MRSRAQIASSRRAWRILRLRGVISFLKELQFPEHSLRDVEGNGMLAITFLHDKEKRGKPE